MSTLLENDFGTSGAIGLNLLSYERPAFRTLPPSPLVSPSPLNPYWFWFGFIGYAVVSLPVAGYTLLCWNDLNQYPEGLIDRVRSGEVLPYVRL